MTAPRPERTVLVLTERALDVRASLEPTAWLVLEELALQSTPVDEQFVAEQSARIIAAALSRSKDAVARALRQLADKGFISRADARHHHFSGRFVGAHYYIDLCAAGLRLPADPVKSSVVHMPDSRAHEPRIAILDPPVDQLVDHSTTRLF